MFLLDGYQAFFLLKSHTHQQEKKHDFLTLSFSLSTPNFPNWNWAFTWELQNNNNNAKKNTHVHSQIQFNKQTNQPLFVSVLNKVCCCCLFVCFFVRCGIWLFWFWLRFVIFVIAYVCMRAIAHFHKFLFLLMHTANRHNRWFA